MAVNVSSEEAAAAVGESGIVIEGSAVGSAGLTKGVVVDNVSVERSAVEVVGAGRSGESRDGDAAGSRRVQAAVLIQGAGSGAADGFARSGERAAAEVVDADDTGLIAEVEVLADGDVSVLI